jgi:hypothetical protein
VYFGKYFLSPPRGKYQSMSFGGGGECEKEEEKKVGKRKEKGKI